MQEGQPVAKLLTSELIPTKCIFYKQGQYKKFEWEKSGSEEETRIGCVTQLHQQYCKISGTENVKG
jgi:hypothetical protein